MKHELYSIEHNFVTLNAYICVELNAHGLYNMILHHIEIGTFKSFLPYMYGSQPCESSFRLLRSMTPTFSTMVNCDMLDAIFKIKKIERMCEISNSKSEESTIIYPNSSQFRSSFDQFDSENFDKDAVNTPEDLPKIAKRCTIPKSEKRLKPICKKFFKRLNLMHISQ